MQISFLFALTACLAFASLLLGGGTRAGFASDAILQFLAVPLLLTALWRWLDTPSGRRPNWVAGFCLAITLLPAVQLLPLPPAIWTALPGREPIIEAFKLIERPLPWMPISVAPQMTRSTILSLIPPFAMFFATLSLGPHERRRLALLLLPVGILSVLLGLVQLAQGQDSSFRFFAHTNPEEAVGFFANRNHLAALLYCLMLFAAALISDSAIAGGSSHSRTKLGTASFLRIIGGMTTIVILLSGEAMARSRMGMALTLVALTGAFALAYSDQRKGSSNISIYKLLFGAMALTLALSFQFALYRILGRFAADSLEDARWTFAKRTLEAATAYFPFGAGFGTFVPVYATFERPSDVMVNAYANHAHDDFIEVFLEGGILGVTLMVGFIAWWGWRTLQIWRRSFHANVEMDESYTRAATLIVMMLLMHSLVDYPLRTAAMMMIFAFSCALMIDPLTPIIEAHRIADGRHEARNPKPHKRRAATENKTNIISAVSPPVTSERAQPPQRNETSLDQIEWPQEWRDK